jgi:protein phosphatase 1 regulatory subunit 16A
MTIRHMDHSALISELPEIEQLPPQQRILLAKDRRRDQLHLNNERETRLPPPPPRNPRLRFSPDVEILEATSRGDANEVARLLNIEHADPNSHNEDGLTPLHQCAIDNNAEIVQILLAAGANVNAKDTELWTPLHAAACCGYIQIVRLLIAKGADLLAVNAEGNMPYDICDDEATLDVIESEMANSGITQEFIDERRAEPERRMLNDMKHLHQNNISLKDERLNDGSTYLHVAAAQGYYDVAAFLIRCDVNVNARDNDFWTPMHAAASWNQPDIIELLFEYGADINAKTKMEEKPLDLCDDQQTRQVILTLQQTEARKKNKFGVRDSRRASRRRKKFMSPEQTTSTPSDNFGTRNGIRRVSLRGERPPIAKVEAQDEHRNLLKSLSKEDVRPEGISSLPDGGRPEGNKGSPTKASKSRQGKTKPPSADDEWAKTLGGRMEDDEEVGGMVRGRGNSTKKKKKKQSDGIAMGQVDDGRGVQPTMGGPNALPVNGSGFGSTIKTAPPPPYPSREKKGCCCAIL